MPGFATGSLRSSLYVYVKRFWLELTDDRGESVYLREMTELDLDDFWDMIEGLERNPYQRKRHMQVWDRRDEEE